MGQKINPKIFRLGIKKTQWDSRYFEKKKEETTFYNYQNIEIQTYLKQFLFLNGLMLQKTKLHFNATNLYLHVSYFSTKKAFILISKKTPNQNIKFKRTTSQNIKLKSTRSIKFKPRPTAKYFRKFLVPDMFDTKTLGTYCHRLTRWRWPSLIRQSMRKKNVQKLREIVEKTPKFFSLKRTIPTSYQLVRNSKRIIVSKYFLDKPFLNKKKKLSFRLFKKLASKKTFFLFKKLASKKNLFLFKKIKKKTLSFYFYKKFTVNSLDNELTVKKKIYFSLFKKYMEKGLTFSVLKKLARKKTFLIHKKLVEKNYLSSFNNLRGKKRLTESEDFADKKRNHLIEKRKKKKLQASLLNKKPWYQKTPRYIKKLKEKNELKMGRLGILKSYKTFLLHRKYKSNAVLKKNLFLEQLLEGLSLYTNKKYNIFLTFQNLNRGMTLVLSQIERDFMKKRLLSLKRYSKEKFFKDSLNVMLVVIKIKNSAKLIAQHIAQQFKFLKRHNYFLTFVKRIATLFISFKTSKVKGIKISISGRFNRAPRAKTRIITAGDVPTQTISKSIDYHEATSYTKNGTFGIKLWVNYD